MKILKNSSYRHLQNRLVDQDEQNSNLHIALLEARREANRYATLIVLIYLVIIFSWMVKKGYFKGWFKKA
jgi:hypothetical protein